MKAQSTEFEPKKWPVQERSRRTFDAIVEACARLLGRDGYGALTTNHIAASAGVGIASLYEYFPDKDTVVAQVAGQLIERVMTRLEQGLQKVMAAPEQDTVYRWIELIYATLREEKDLIVVLSFQVPYTNRLPQVRAIRELLLQFSQAAARRAGLELATRPADLHLLNNLVSSTILQLLLEPPEDVTAEELLQALSSRVEYWLVDGKPS